ncbi:MAG TPA: cell division topological specificity factor MinE [Anaerolineaceae bacterium]
MAGLMDWLKGTKTTSADQAKDRLKLVLIHDRVNITPTALEEMKNEIIEVIARHVEIDPSAVQIRMAQEGREQRLMADIPLKPPTRRRRT